MKNIKKYLPLIVCSIILLVGIILFLIVGSNNTSLKEGFLGLSLLIIGAVGSLASLFIILSNKKFNNEQSNKTYTTISTLFKSELEKFNEQKENQNTENIEPQPEFKHKKIKCTYCKCKYDNTLNRCPNCGAPPESDK